MKFLSQEGLAYLWTKIKSRFEVNETAIAGKVDKVEGKGLSTEDYTAAEKTKLAGIAEGANNYTLPAATSGAIGGVKPGTNVSVASDGTISATDTTYTAATTETAGLMSAADKTKLDGVATGANAYVLPKAAADTLGGVKVGNNLTMDPTTGVLSANAGAYTLPIAGSGTLGGVKISGGNLSIDNTGLLSSVTASRSAFVNSVRLNDNLLTENTDYMVNCDATFYGDGYPNVSLCWMQITLTFANPLAVGDKVTLTCQYVDFLGSGIVTNGTDSTCGTFLTSIGEATKIEISKSTQNAVICTAAAGYYL
jgi:hypothetical protein